MAAIPETRFATVGNDRVAYQVLGDGPRDVLFTSGFWIGGVAVHIGARVSALANADEVLVSPVVQGMLLGSRFKFEERGTHALKGVRGEWALFAVT